MNTKRQLAKILRFGMTKRLRRGGRVTIFPSYKCNFDCWYCTLKVDGVFPVNETLPLEKWQYFLTKFDEATRDNNGIREVILTGGEPTLLPYFTELVNWILFIKKWHLTMFTNLTTNKLLEIKPSLRLRVCATFHHGDNLQRFDTMYKTINAVHRVDVEEIDVKCLPYSRVKPYLTLDEILYDATSLRVSPSQTIHLTCRGACENFTR